MPRRLTVCGLGLVLGAMVLFRPALSVQQSRATGEAPTVATLAADVAALKDKAVDQAHAMASVEYHYSRLWFAGKAANWPLAQFYWNETRSHLRWAVRVIPIRKDNAGKEVNLRNILEAFENTPLKQLEEAIAAKDSAKFEASYKFTLETCYSCHKAADKPYLRPKIPESPGDPMINFDPLATWPL